MSCRFVVMSDTHFINPPVAHEATWWNRTTHRFSEQTNEAFIELVKRLSPDFAVHCGDFTGESSTDNFKLGTTIMNRLCCPWYAVPGNHDTWGIDSDSIIKKTFGCSSDIRSYTKELHDLKFIFFDVANWYDRDGECMSYYDREKAKDGAYIGMGPSEKDIIWLEDELRNTDLPAVIVSHAPIAFKDAYPLKTLPYGKPVKGSMTKPSDFIDDIINRDKLYQVIRNSPSVKACFAGHWHINDALARNGVLYVMTASLREFPFEIRLVEYSHRCFRISTHGLDVPSIKKASYVRKWGNKWVEGTPDVREFSFTFT